MGKVEVVIQFYRDLDLPRLNPAMLPITYLGEISHVWVVLKKEGDSLEQCGLVPYLVPGRKLIFSENPYCRAWLYRASLSIQALFFPAAVSKMIIIS
ncbi:MAG: hypothetical protein KZQ63_14245 [Candidatus Thiodiazotropha sp. (ex Lucinoma aequizonata)]|nr:hypothetical protein [Candidatus Thiodiazotropha sp. (ex Lucinoma aequizonata)]